MSPPLFSWSTASAPARPENADWEEQRTQCSEQGQGSSSVKAVNTFLLPFLTIKMICYPSHSQHTQLYPKSPTCEIEVVLAGFNKTSNRKDKMLTCSLEKCNICSQNSHPGEERLLHFSQEDIHCNWRTLPLRNNYSPKLLTLLNPPSWTATSSYFLICCLINPYWGLCSCPDPCYILPGCPK